MAHLKPRKIVVLEPGQPRPTEPLDVALAELEFEMLAAERAMDELESNWAQLSRRLAAAARRKKKGLVRPSTKDG
jgi:hypothetical protein